MRAVLQLLRVGNTLVAFLGTVVAGVVAVGSGFSLPVPALVSLGLAAASTALVTAGGNVLNDLRDRESDRVNHPERPLVVGSVSLARARQICMACLLASGLTIGPLVLSLPLLGAVWLSAVGLLLAYEFRWKAAGSVGNLAVAGLTAAVFVYGGAAVGQPLAALPLAAMAFFATWSREIIKDMEDVAGDVERSTLPRVRGMRASAGLARAAVAAAVSLSLTPFWLLPPVAGFTGVMYGASVAVADGLFLASVLWLPRRLHEEQSLSKAAMAVALLAFLSLGFRGGGLAWPAF